MHADAGAFTCRVEAGNAGFSPLIGSDPTHLIVRAGANRNGGFDGIEAGKLNGEFSDLREPFENTLASKVPQVQQHAPIDPAALQNFLPDGQ